MIYKLSFVFQKDVKGGNTVRSDVGAMMVVVFTNAEISYLAIDLFNDLVKPLSFFYL